MPHCRAIQGRIGKNPQEHVDIARGKVMRAGDRNELEDHVSQDVEHGTEWRIHSLGVLSSFWLESSLTQVGDPCRFPIGLEDTGIVTKVVGSLKLFQ